LPAILASCDEVRGRVDVERVLAAIEADEDAERLDLGVLFALVADDPGERDSAAGEQRASCLSEHVR
jgi:hypothetical protein